MAIYEVELEDGSIYEVETEDGSEEQKPGLLDSMSAIASQGTKGPLETLGKMGMSAMESAQKPFDVGGEAVAEGLAGPGLRLKQPFPGLPAIPVTAKPGEKALKLPPVPAAAVGATFANLPQIVASVEGIGAARPIGKALTAGLKGLFKSGKSVATKLGPEEILTLESDLTNLGVAKEKDLAKLENLKRAFGKEIESSRGAAGIPQRRMSDLTIPEDVIKFADKMKTFGKYSPETLAQYGKQNLADIKDTVQIMRDTGKIVPGTRISAQINEGVKSIDNALAKLAPETEGPIMGYRKASEQIENLPDFYKERAAELRNQIRDAKAANKPGVMRKLASEVFKSVPWVGGGILGRLMSR
jgi:hypothetical protein